ncbi:PucR family transcriptional regulator [Nocardioides daphniae]|uniref:PucR family transcriptional regulator n=1 Tax=Nocardioides daphniae TaxID=402297 RepID=A0ABQ1QLN2_9ACTN|nr:helix-turn-helix domain-containing protein [Nocardioides daphniae]GGD30102.1 PucR family transcriptional regulator [Nocardioides daphniae]
MDTDPREPATHELARLASALARASGAMSTAATARMDRDMPWFADLSASDRSWVGLIVHAGIQNFVDWLRSSASTPDGSGPDGHALATAVFGAAPRELAGVITLRQTVDLIRLSIDVVESHIDDTVAAEDAPLVHRAVLRYGREVAFATAEVYARAAESRGAWDARLEALVVDAVLRAEPDDSLLSRANALGWNSLGGVAVVMGASPDRRTDSDVFEGVRRAARTAGADALCAVQGDRLVVVLGGVEDALAGARSVVHFFGDGPVVVGPVTSGLGSAHVSARAALSAHRASAGWPEAPRPVRSLDLLAERALAGDGHARRHLVEAVFLPLSGPRRSLVETLAAWFEAGGSTEATARALFVHPNTVRYRLRQVAEVTGLTPTMARDAFTLQIALVLGRQSGRAPTDPAL